MGITDVLSAWFAEREKELISNYKSKGLRASGRFENELHSEISADGGVMKAPLYAETMVKGRKPTSSSTGSGKSLVDVIKQWISDKGITPSGNISSNSLAFLIARSIHSKGTLLYRGDKSYNDGNLLIDTFTQEKINNLNSEIGSFYVTSLQQQIKDTWQRV
jgi:hypothetical protein